MYAQSRRGTYILYYKLPLELVPLTLRFRNRYPAFLWVFSCVHKRLGCLPVQNYRRSNIDVCGFTYDRLHVGLVCLAIRRCYCKHNGLFVTRSCLTIRQNRMICRATCIQPNIETIVAVQHNSTDE